MSCDVGHRCSSGLALLWLWCRLAAIALIRPLAWEPPYAEGAALKKAKRQKKKKEKETGLGVFLRRHFGVGSVRVGLGGHKFPGQVPASLPVFLVHLNCFVSSILFFHWKNWEW